MVMASVSTVSLRLVIDTEGNRVLYAESGKEFVDFLFNILSLPVGIVTSLLPKEDAVGCLRDLYESLENLSGTYMESATNKNALLKPILCSYSPSLSMLLPNMESQTTYLYSCSNYFCPVNYVTHDPKFPCSNCKGPMSLKMNSANPKNVGGGFVKTAAIYMVMDNLEVKPLSSASIFSLLNKFNVKAPGAIEEREIQIEPTEGVKLLKMCLQSKTVLTDLFLEKKVEKCDVTILS